MTKQRVLVFIGTLILGYLIYNSIIICQYSSVYSESKSDVAIVLGAGTYNDHVSPIFRERINQALYLYNMGLVKKVIFTGGYGNGQAKSDSQLAKEFAIAEGMPDSVILIEESSKYTIENLSEAKSLMDSLNLRTALVVSDPLHMKRAIALAEKMNIECKSSPTRTSMYRSTIPKAKSLLYETLFLTAGQLTGKN